MDAYEKPYLRLWTSCGAAADALERQNFGLAREILLRAQREADALLAEQRETQRSTDPQ